MPTLNKYPDATVLITDDDVKRTDDWLQTFVDDHKKYPKDVIVGYSAWKLGNNFKQTTASNVRTSGFSFRCVTEPEKILHTERPANGLGGVLYPSHTFTDPRFFDEELFMKLSPYSDESWQYCFNVIEDRTLRMTSKIVEWSKYIIKGTEKTALAKHNTQYEYTRLYNLFFKEFPEYKEKMTIRLQLEEGKVPEDIIQKNKKAEPVKNKIADKPFVACQLTGRLGNNLFQIATARYFVQTHNMDVKFYFSDKNCHKKDLEYFKKSDINSILKEPVTIISNKDIFNGTKFIDASEQSSIVYSEIPFVTDKNINITGNRQSERYFNKTFAKQLFDFSEVDKEVKRLYGNLSDIGALHIRRTDYINKHYRYLTEDDVKKIRECFPNDDFIIFSDDIDWCKKKFSDLNFKYPPVNDSKYDDSIIELAAMRQCMAVIISNSTFSWWAAYLSERPGHITVYKKPWFTDSTSCDIIPNDKSWIIFEDFLKLSE